MKEKKKKTGQWQQWLFMGFFVLIGAVCGVLMVCFTEQNATEDSSLIDALLPMVVLFIGMYAGIYLQLIIHEAGHLVFGLLSGYRFSSFRIGSFMWIKKNNKISIKRLTLTGTGGQCLMVPPQMQHGKIPVILFNLGGSIMNLIASIIFLIVYLLIPSGTIISFICLIMVLIGVAIALMNGIPLRLGTVDNDGYNALSLGKNPDAMRAFWLQLKVNEQIAKGVRLKDMPDEWFTVPEDKAMHNSMVATQGVLASNRLMDQQRFEEADQLIAHLLGIESGIVGLHRSLMICDLIYCELIRDQHKEIVDGMLTKEQIKFMKAMKKFPSVIRTEYVYALLALKDENKVKEARELFEKVAKTYPYPSDIQSERELIEIADNIAGATLYSTNGRGFSMDQSITGSMIIAEHECPFSYGKETEKIIIYTGNRGITIPDGLDVLVGQKFGMLSGGNVLYKLSVPLSNDTMTFVGSSPQRVSCANQIRSVEYYIEGYFENSKYSEMRLQFPELNYFFASIGRATIMEKQVVFFREKKTLCSFDFGYHDTDVNISFVTKMDCHSGVKTTAETISEVSLSFPETDDLEYLRGLYEVVRCFFSFICNRRNIGLRSAVLIGTYPTKRIEGGKVVDATGFTAPTMFFSQKYLEPEEDKKVISQTPNWGLFSEKIPELFRLFSEDAVDSIATVNGNGVHHSVKYRNLIDLEQSLHITATFECYVRTLLPEMSSESTIAFIKDLQLLLDEYIEKTSGQKKQKAKGFKKGLSPQIALEDKLRKVYNGYSSWKPLKPMLCEWFGEDISGLASAANLWRNELAHEKREYQPGIEVVNAIRLVEHMNYCIVLRYAGYDDDQIKSIIEEILVR